MWEEWHGVKKVYDFTQLSFCFLPVPILSPPPEKERGKEKKKEKSWTDFNLLSLKNWREMI